MAGGWEGALRLDGVYFSRPAWKLCLKKKLFRRDGDWWSNANVSQVILQRTPETLKRSFRLRRKGGFSPALTPDSLQYEQTGPLPFTLMLSAVSGGRRVPSSLCVWNSLCVCLTKPSSQAGAEYRNGRIVPTSSTLRTSSSLSAIMKLLLCYNKKTCHNSVIGYKVARCSVLKI